MKRVLKYVIIAVIILGAAFLYAHIDKKVPVFDKTVDSTYYGNMGEITTGLRVQQKFLCIQTVLNATIFKVLYWLFF